MTAQGPILVDPDRLKDALARYPRDRAMLVGGRENKGEGETIERLSPAQGVVVTPAQRGQGLHRGEDLSCPRRPTNELVAAAEDLTNIKDRKPVSGF